MPFPVSRLVLCAIVLSTLPALLAPAECHAQWPDRLSRLPEAPNAVAVFNMVQLRLMRKNLEGSPGQPAERLVEEVGMDIAGQMHYFAICAHLDLENFEPQWEVSLSSASKIPTAEEIAAVEGGYVDRIGERKIVRSQRNAYMLPLDEKRLAVIRPANRQRMVRWEQIAREEKSEGLSPYLKQAVSVRTDDVPVILAIELDGAVSPVQARAKLAELEALAGMGADLDALASLFGDLEGVVFSASRGPDALMGSLRVDFGRPADALQKVGKAVAIEILDNAGMHLAELETWSSRIQGNSLILSGPVSTLSLRQALSFLSTPNLVSSMQETASFSTSSEGGRVSLEQVQLKATKFYFDTTQVAIHQVRNSKARNAAGQVTWNERAARKIDDQPMLNVDAEMLDYGRQVADLLRGAALTIRSANMDAGVAKSGMSSTVTRVTGVWSGPYNTVVRGVNESNPALRVATREANRQGNVAHQQNMAQIDQLSLEIRRRMTERYQTAF